VARIISSRFPQRDSLLFVYGTLRTARIFAIREHRDAVMSRVARWRPIRFATDVTAALNPGAAHTRT
jgi:hypothetical protein